ncbi:FAD-dependent oxidoreductase [Chloroflexota bacterium]
MVTVSKTDVLVIGGGMAGLWAGVRARQGSVQVMLVDKAEPGKCGQSAFAAGDIDILPPGEDLDKLANAWLAEFPLASKSMLTEFLATSYAKIKEMQSWGIVFETDKSGKLDIRNGPAGKRRVLTPGFPLMQKLRNHAEGMGINIRSRLFITDLLINDHEVIGVVGFDIRTGEKHRITAKSVVMATACYGVKANNFQGTGFLAGDGLAMAYRAGAALYNTEFLRGNTGHRDHNTVGMAKFTAAFGGRMLNTKGEYFMSKYRPNAEKPDVAPNYEFWIAMAKEVQAGNGPIYFDITGIKPDDYQLARRLLPHLFKSLDAAGVDIREKPMPWIPVGYRGFGGLLHDQQFRSSLNGLFACGDATSAVTFGWAIYSGAKAGTAAADYVAWVNPPHSDESQAEKLLDTAFRPLRSSGKTTPDEIIYKIQSVLVPYDVLILKNADSLKKALEEIVSIREDSIPCLKARDTHELMKTNEAINMALITEVHLRAALLRQESRNFHYRTDFPEKNDNNWYKWLCVNKTPAGINITEEPVSG